MAATAQPRLMTVEQYRQLPELDDAIQELHLGCLVTLTRPKMKHAKIQARLGHLLRPKAKHLGIVESEVAFRAIPEYELRAADVAFVSQARWDATPDDDNLHGAPELVIEVLSPSNTPQEMDTKSSLCLANGAREFWMVDPKKNTVTVLSNGSELLYQASDKIPLSLFGGELTVSDIFA